jgi:hypothetical protein
MISSSRGVFQPKVPIRPVAQMQTSGSTKGQTIVSTNRTICLDGSPLHQQTGISRHRSRSVQVRALTLMRQWMI